MLGYGLIEEEYAPLMFLVTIGQVNDIFIFSYIDLNRAVNKTAWQSSTLFSEGVNLTADRAVDGNFEQFGSSRTCSSTFFVNPAQPWWYVDMGSVSKIDYIAVYGKDGMETEN